jgi:toxin ParE1/3/4
MPAPRRSPPWSLDAVADLSDTWNYYARVAGRSVADAISGKIHEACRILVEHPLAGRARDEVRPGLRCLVVPPHVVFYRVIEGGAEIVRVIDGRRDIEDAFDETLGGD